MNQLRRNGVHQRSMRIALLAAALVVSGGMAISIPAAAGTREARGSELNAADRSASGSSPRLVAYRGSSGHVWRDSGDLGKLKATSTSFRKFIAHELSRMWRLDGSKPACTHSQVIQVRRWRSDGFAVGYELWRAHDGDPTSCTVSEGDDSLFKKTKQGWRKIAGSPSYVFDCTNINRYYVPAAVGGAACQTFSSPAHTYGPKVVIHLRFGACRHCHVTLTQASNAYGVYWHSKTKAVRPGSATTFRVRESRTAGMSFEVHAPWATGVNWVPNVVTHYQGLPLGKSVSTRQAATAKKGSACWAGAATRTTNLNITVNSFRTTDMTGNPAKGLRAYIARGLNEGGAKWTTTFKGSLGNQDAYYC
jgi:hypothetical protein